MTLSGLADVRERVLYSPLCTSTFATFYRHNRQTPFSFRAPTMSQYGKLILIIGVVVACAVGAILPFAFASNAVRDEDANALRDVGRLLQTQGAVSNYSIAVWTDSLDMTLATSDTSEAAIVAYQVCSEHKIPLRHQWIVRIYLDNGHKVAECEIER
jgi:hypothetical protein